MLGKMIKDGWFPRAVLEDEEYNAAVLEEAAACEALKEARIQVRSLPDVGANRRGPDAQARITSTTSQSGFGW